MYHYETVSSTLRLGESSIARCCGYIYALEGTKAEIYPSWLGAVYHCAHIEDGVVHIDARSYAPLRKAEALFSDLAELAVSGKLIVLCKAEPRKDIPPRRYIITPGNVLREMAIIVWPSDVDDSLRSALSLVERVLEMKSEIAHK